MKTIEEKAKAYDEALERARIWKEKSGMPIDKQGILDDIFPELAESEDEKIRKDIRQCIKLCSFVPSNGTTKDEMFAWLEKQVSHDMVADAYLRGCNDTEKKWLESKRYTKMDVDNDYLEGIANAKREFEKQGKQEWTEEDESMFKDIIGYLQAMPIFFESVSSAKSGKEYTKKFIKDSVNWLKSIKERMQ